VKRTLSVAVVLVAALAAVAACGTPHADVGANRARRVAQHQVYVAMGDSYTSAPEVGGATGPTECMQTSLNYPHLVAEKMGLTLKDASCGGATTGDLGGSQKVKNAQIAPQMDSLTNDTDLVTLSIGANDQGVFAKLLVACGHAAATDPEGSPCTDASGDYRAKLQSYQSVLVDRITKAVSEISQRAPKARVLLVGYPQMIAATAPPSGHCSELALAKGDFAYAHAVLLTLNDAVRIAAQRSKAEFVDIWDASKGHDMCSADPWMAGAVPRHPAMPYHPYAVEQAKVAGLIEQALRK